MAVYVNTNYSALQGQRYLGNVQNQLTIHTKDYQAVCVLTAPKMTLLASRSPIA